MFHTWIGTDCGVQCLRCAVVLDYLNPDTEERYPIDERAAETARDLVPGCPGPTERAHHFVLEMEPVINTGIGEITRWVDILSCAYGDAKSSAHRWTANTECVGA